MRKNYVFTGADESSTLSLAMTKACFFLNVASIQKRTATYFSRQRRQGPRALYRSAKPSSGALRMDCALYLESILRRNRFRLAR